MRRIAEQGGASANPTAISAKETLRAWIWPYAFALVSVVATLVVRLKFSVAFSERPMMIMFVLPIIASAYIGGTGVGLFATVLASSLLDFFLIPPLYSVKFMHANDFVHWCMLVVSGVAISILIGRLRRARADSDDALETLIFYEETQHRLLQNLSTAVVVHAPDTRILFSNPAASRLLGLTQAQMQGKQAMDSAWHFEHEDGSIMSVESYPVNRVLADRQPLRDYVLGIHASLSSEVTWVLVNAFPDFNADQTLRQVVVTFGDITAIKKAEAALRENEAVLNSFFESPGILRGIVEVVEGDILHIRDNTTAAAFFGRAPEAMQGRLASEMGVPAETVSLWVGHYLASQQSGQPVIFSYEHKEPAGVRWLLATVIFLGIRSSGRPRFSYSVRDNSRVKQLETQLAQAQKMEAIG